jgi:Mn2+/Fe2+ NRAMP family transporter
MGEFKSVSGLRFAGWTVAGIILALNAVLLAQMAVS